MEAEEGEIVFIDGCGFEKRKRKIGENKFHECQHRQVNGGFFFSPRKNEKNPVFCPFLIVSALIEIIATRTKKN